MSKLSRRTALSLAAALPAAAVPVSAFPAMPDPIYAAIEARELARAHWDTIAEQDEEAYNNAGDAEAKAALRICTTVPTTLAGVLTVLRYIIECGHKGDEILNLYVTPDDYASDHAKDVFLKTLATAIERMEGNQ